MKEIYPEAYPENTEKQRANNPENGIERKEAGKNAIRNIYIIRHGERLPDQIGLKAELTKNGIEESIKFGNKIGTSAIIGGECSCDENENECLRTLLTARAAAFGSHAYDIRPIEKREELSSHASEAFRNKIRAYVREKLRKNPNLTDEEINNMDLLSTVEGIDFYLNCKDEDLDEQTYSPLETAASITLRVSNAIEKTNEMESETGMDYLIATHDYVIAAFLQQVLLRETENGQMKRGFDSLAELGDSPIEFLENIKITARTNDEGKIITETNSDGKDTISLEFREKTYKLDMSRLRELVKYGNHLKDAEKFYSK